MEPSFCSKRHKKSETDTFSLIDKDGDDERQLWISSETDSSIEIPEISLNNLFVFDNDNIIKTQTLNTTNNHSIIKEMPPPTRKIPPIQTMIQSGGQNTTLIKSTSKGNKVLSLLGLNNLLDRSKLSLFFQMCEKYDIQDPKVLVLIYRVRNVYQQTDFFINSFLELSEEERALIWLKLCNLLQQIRLNGKVSESL